MTKEEFKIHFEAYNKQLIYYAETHLGNMYSEDIVADSFLVLWEIRDSLKHDNIRAVLYTILRRNIRMAIKTKDGKHGKYRDLRSITTEMEESFFSEEEADGTMIKAEFLKVLTKKVNSFPEIIKETFILMNMYGLSIKECAIALKTTSDAIKYRKKIIKDTLIVFGISVIPKNYWVIQNNSERGSGPTMVLSKKVVRPSQWKF